MNKKFPFTILTIDLETRWNSADYTLSKMTTEEYIRDPRFKAFGACIHELGSDRKTQWYKHEELERIFATYDWTKTAILCQNTRFDGGILSFIYGVRPVFNLDTLSMARAFRGAHVSNSLAKMAEDYGLPPKGRAVHSTDGLDELPPHIEHELAEYCKHDIALTEQVFGKLLYRVDHTTGTPMGEFSTSELKLIDLTIKMYTHADLVLDREMLEEALGDDVTRLSDALARVGVDEKELGSNERFAALLEGIGIEPPTKISKTTGKETYAFAKTDAMFQALLNGDNEIASALCEARLRVKSTLERTRTQRFIDIQSRGTLPIPLNYYAASTGRWGGSDSVNFQNLRRGSPLRKAIMAPEGYEIIAGDLSQIEPRVLAWLADYSVMLDTFRAGGDPYATFGSQMFSIPGLSKESHPLLRQSAKSALLGAGYMLSWAAFSAQLLVGFLGAPPQRYVKADAIQLGVTKQDVIDFVSNKTYMRKMARIARTCTDEELVIHCVAAKAIIDKYRKAAEPVTYFWRTLGDALVHCLHGGDTHDHKGVLQFRKGEIELVNGMRLQYPDIQVSRVRDPDSDRESDQFTYFDGRGRRKLHPGVLANNCTQALARIVMTDGMLRVAKRLPLKGTVHDELWALARTEVAADECVWVKEQMIITPKWMPGIPLNADVGHHRRYGLAKG